MGTACMIFFIAAVMLFIAGLSYRYIFGAAIAAIPLICIAIASVPYRLQRVQAYFSPGADPQGHGFQLVQSLIAVGSGGFTGVGLMESRQKLFFLPEAHTDFIFSVICEEAGFIGAVIVLALFAVYGWRGFVAAMKAPDDFGRFLGIGITTMVVGQALINLERRPRPAADKRDSAAVHQLRRIEPDGNAAGHGRAAEHQPARG